MVRRCILCLCQCVIDDLYKRNTDFNDLSDSVVFNDYHDLRKNCTCRFRKAHSFGYIYCRRRKELLIKFFSYETCKTASKFCFHSPRVACNECFDFYNLYFLKDSILRFVYLPWYCLKDILATLKCLITLKLTTFIRLVEKLNKMEMNKWINNFKTHLRKFYITDDLAFVHNVLSKEFGVAAADIKVLIIENKREYVSSDLEKILSKYWEHSLSKQWARI